MDGCYRVLTQNSGVASSRLKHWYGVHNQRSIHRWPTEQMRQGSGESVRESLGHFSSNSGAGKHLVRGCFPGNVWAYSVVVAFSDILIFERPNCQLVGTWLRRDDPFGIPLAFRWAEWIYLPKIVGKL